nr:sulfite exporter TauE/SafE family protein [Nocardioides ginsengisegetis]
MAAVAGVVIGLALGALGGGGSVLAVPVLVALGQTPLEATTGSLVVVGTSATLGAVAARRRGNVLVGRGLGFGAVALGGAWLGAHLAARVPDPVLLGLFALLMVVVAVSMVLRARRPLPEPGDADEEPIIGLHPFVCRCPRALKVLVTATGVGLLTGFLGVGGGFVVVPALVLALGLAPRVAGGTSLVVIALTSAASLLFRAGSGVHPAWGLVLLLALAASLGAVLGARVATRVNQGRLTRAFAGVVLAAALVTSTQAVLAHG